MFRRRKIIVLKLTRLRSIPQADFVFLLSLERSQIPVALFLRHEFVLQFSDLEHQPWRSLSASRHFFSCPSYRVILYSPQIQEELSSLQSKSSLFFSCSYLLIILDGAPCLGVRCSEHSSSWAGRVSYLRVWQPHADLIETSIWAARVTGIVYISVERRDIKEKLCLMRDFS